MIDPVSGSGTSALLRTQTTQASVGIAALKSNQQAQQAIINQLQKGLDTSKAITAAAAAQPRQLPANASSLPRGSLVDMVV